MKEVFMWLIGIFIFIGIFLATDYFIGYQWFSFIEPKKENVRREIFLNTRSYNEAKLQDLTKYRYEYMKSDREGKEAIASTIRHMFAEYDENRLPIELKTFLQEIKYGEVLP